MMKFFALLDRPRIPVVMATAKTGRIVVLLVILLGPGLSLAFAQKVDVTFRESVDFGSYRSFSFRQFRVMRTNEPWRDGTTELRANGLTPTDEDPDIYVAVYLGFDQDQAVDHTGEFLRRRDMNNMATDEAFAQPQTHFFNKGFGLIELIDAKTKLPIWRGYGFARYTIFGTGRRRSRRLQLRPSDATLPSNLRSG